MICVIIVRAYKHVVIVGAMYWTLYVCRYYDEGKISHQYYTSFFAISTLTIMIMNMCVLCDGTVHICIMRTLSTAYVHCCGNKFNLIFA